MSNRTAITAQPRPFRRGWAAVIVLVAVVILAAGCSSEGTAGGAPPESSVQWRQEAFDALQGQGGRPVDPNADGAALAFTLKANADFGPAAFRVADADTGKLVLDGRIDFRGLSGSGMTEAGWAVKWDSAGATMDGAAAPADLTALIQALHSFGTVQPDNPVLVAQNGALLLSQTEDSYTFAPSGDARLLLQVRKSDETTQRAFMNLTVGTQHRPILITFEFES